MILARVVVILAAATVAAPRPAEVPAVPAIPIRATAVPLNPDNPSQSAVGRFTYAGGLALVSNATEHLHGLSDLEVTGDGRVTAVSDDGFLFTGRVVLDRHGRLVNVRDVRIAPLPGEDGTPLDNKAMADAEGLAVLPNGDRLVSFEREHRIWLYPARGGAPRPVPKPDVVFPVANGGMEALAADPGRGRDAYIVGAELTGDTWTCRVSTQCVAAATIARPAGTSLVAIRRMPAGRTAYLFRGFADNRARSVLRVARGADAVAELDLTPPLTVDNIEGVAAVTRPNGVMRFYLVSDDNSSSSQRTLLLAFDWRAS